MIYTNSITSKGQITLPKEFRDKLGLDVLGKAQISMSKRGEIVIRPAKSLSEIRKMLAAPTGADAPTNRERTMGAALVKKYGVR